MKFVEGVETIRFLLNNYRWKYVAGDRSALVSARLLTPPVPGVVILDATASTNSTYTHQTKVYDILDLPRVRDYKNAELVAHVTNVKGGKRGESEEIARHALVEVGAVHGDALLQRRVLIVTHKRHAEAFRAYWCAAGFTTAKYDAEDRLLSGNLDVAWYGDVDGANRWSWADTVVIPTLLYYDVASDIMAIDALARRRPTNETLRYQDPGVLQRLREERVVLALAQALGRANIRDRADVTGACAPAVFHVFLPKSTANVRWPNIVAGTEGQLKGLRATERIEPDGPALDRGTWPDLIALVRSVGRVDRALAMRRLGMSSSLWDKMVKASKEPAMVTVLEAVGLQLVYAPRRGRSGWPMPAFVAAKS
jgi:hypothetical protein